MKNIIYILLISNFTFAQTATLDTNSILIGQQINFTITNEVINTDVWPGYDDFLVEELEIINASKVDTTNGIINQKFIITAWDSGSYYIPPITFSATKKTKGLLINVQSVTLEEGAELKDIKQPINEPIGWSDIWPWLLAFLTILIIVYMIRKYVITKSETEKTIKPKKIIPPDVTALKQLAILKEKGLWQSGKLKQYHSEISEILRAYIEVRFQILALESPTYEILENLQKKNLQKDDLIMLTTLLERADLAKYAKSQPIDKENEESLLFGQNFVNNTKIIQVDE